MKTTFPLLQPIEVSIKDIGECRIGNREVGNMVVNFDLSYFFNAKIINCKDIKITNMVHQIMDATKNILIFFYHVLTQTNLLKI